MPDQRFPANLPNGPYQITRYVPYINSYVGDPIHRFYQMWQEQDNGKHDLYTWVHQTAGDDNGANPPLPIHQGALDMGYYNMCTGDAPNFNFIGDNYAISDNYHQSVMGGTGANHIMLGTGDAAYYQDANGNPTTPPSTRSRIPTPNLEPTTTTIRKTATQEAVTATAPTQASRVSDQSSSTCIPCRISRSATVIVHPGPITCSITTRPAIRLPAN